MADGCIFCRIIAGEIPGTFVHQDDEVVAFKDINPVAPVHVLVIPKAHVACVDDAGPEHVNALGSLFLSAKKVAAELKLSQGYRMVVNNGANAGQTVFHVHMHVLGGEPLRGRFA